MRANFKDGNYSTADSRQKHSYLVCFSVKEQKKMFILLFSI